MVRPNFLFALRVSTTQNAQGSRWPRGGGNPVARGGRPSAPTAMDGSEDDSRGGRKGVKGVTERNHPPRVSVWRSRKNYTVGAQETTTDSGAAWSGDWLGRLPQPLRVFHDPAEGIAQGQRLNRVAHLPQTSHTHRAMESEKAEHYESDDTEEDPRLRLVLDLQHSEADELADGSAKMDITRAWLNREATRHQQRSIADPELSSSSRQPCFVKKRRIGRRATGWEEGDGLGGGRRVGWVPVVRTANRKRCANRFAAQE